MQLEHVPCNLCGADDPEFMFESIDLWHAMANSERQKFRVIRCRRCGLAYVTPRIPAHRISAYYPDDYVAHSAHPVPPVPPSALGKQAFRWRRAQFEQWRRGKSLPSRVQRLVLGIFGQTLYARHDPFRFPGEGLRILDIGCGIGDYLANKQALGWEVYGVEPSERAAEVCRQRGLPVEPGPFDGRRWPPAWFDAVTMRQVLEHMPEPKAVMTDVTNLLKSRGILYVTVPNLRSIPARLFRNYWIGVDVPRHYYYYTPTTLRHLLQGAGLRVITWYTLSSTSGFTAAFEFIARERFGLKVGRDNIRKNRFLTLLVLPAVCFSDWLKLGDNLHALALKPA